jgi:Cu/Ag efflux protein CusF
MKTVPKAVAAGLLTLVVVLVAVAETGEVAGVKTKKPVDAYPFAKGVIEKLDLTSQRITLTTEGGSRVFDLTPATYIFRGKDKLSPDKLKPGDSIKLNYYTNDLGRALIRRIKVDLSGPPPS